MEQPKNNFKIVSDKKARMLLPNTLTLINVCIGLSSIKFALDAKFELSIIAILFAAVFDDTPQVYKCNCYCRWSRC